MKQKRIKALVRYIDAEDSVWSSPEWGLAGSPPSEPCYLIRQSDVRALAEQMVRSSAEWYKLPESAASDPRAIAASLHCLKRAGITPGQARRGGTP
jgi:hypothetical protein